MTTNILHQQRLENGLELVFTDLSNRYYGDFYQVKIDVLTRILLTETLLHASGLSEREQLRARGRFGEVLEVHRELKRMGVAGPEVGAVTQQLVQQFLATSLPYLSVAGFPARMLRQTLSDQPTQGSPRG